MDHLIPQKHKWFIDYGGGLGDIINQIFNKGSYQFISTLTYESALIALICHNPHVVELFNWHPKKDNFEVRFFEWWHPDQNRKNKIKHNLPLSQKYKVTKGDPIFYSSPEDKKILINLPQKFYVLSASAGIKDRNIPNSILDIILNNSDIPIISVGRTYERIHKETPREEIILDHPNVINLVDKLSVPGTLNLLDKSCGLITCHSALNIYGWYKRLPTLLLYPQETYNEHFKTSNEWSFGKDFPETIHKKFTEFNIKDIEKLHDNRKT